MDIINYMADFADALEVINVLSKLGVHEVDRRMFTQVFDELIEILSEPSNVKKLIKAKNFDDFLQRISHMMDLLEA